MNPNINSQFDSESSRKEFEKFLTYRRRMGRMSAVQALALYESWVIANDKKSQKNLQELLKLEPKELSITLTEEIIFIYVTTFLEYKDHYERQRKARKIDEEYIEEILINVLSNLNYIDEIISKYLNNWTIENLDPTIKSILRAAIGEILYNSRIEIPILTSEYTNITSLFFTGKSIGFVNGIIDKIAKNMRK